MSLPINFHYRNQMSGSNVAQHIAITSSKYALDHVRDFKPFAILFNMKRIHTPFGNRFSRLGSNESIYTFWNNVIIKNWW